MMLSDDEVERHLWDLSLGLTSPRERAADIGRVGAHAH
jgi:hypothetical protein